LVPFFIEWNLAEGGLVASAKKRDKRTFLKYRYVCGYSYFFNLETQKRLRELTTIHFYFLHLFNLQIIYLATLIIALWEKLDL
jgi:hypothetical protein